MYKVFLSHSSRDAWIIKQIQRQILKITGVATFLDDGNINIGDDFEKVILKELRESKELLVLLTPWALTRKYVWLEIGAAWGLGLRIIFVLYETTLDDATKNDFNPMILSRVQTTTLNEIEEYFSQLQTRTQNNEE